MLMRVLATVTEGFPTFDTFFPNTDFH